MPATPLATRDYDALAKTFHWLVLALLVGQYAIAWTMPEIRFGVPATGLVAAHLSVGATILAVVVLRLARRTTSTLPPPPRDLPKVLQVVSRLTHYALYAILLVLPVLGWVSASARDYPVYLAGVVPLPALSAPDHPLAASAGDLHAIMATALLVVAGLHVAGALYHAVILRDGVFQRMLPRGRVAGEG